MSTIQYENWAVDLANVAAIYPFQGWEIPMTIVGVIFWLGWHWIQFVGESAELAEAERNFKASEATREIERY